MTERFCCDGRCSQGRDCPSSNPRESWRLEIAARIVSVAILAGAVACIGKALSWW